MLAHSAVEGGGGQVRSIVRPERRRVYLFFILFYIFLANIFFSGGNTSLSRNIVATILFSFYTLSITVVYAQ